MTLLIVTPVRNEIANVEGLVETVRGQTYTDFVWLVVDDGSSDGTAERLRSLDETVQIVSKQNDGGLIGGSAYTSWRFGVETALVAGAFTHIMKLDADVRLAPDYLERVVPLAAGDVGVAGGVGGRRECAIRTRSGDRCERGAGPWPLPERAGVSLDGLLLPVLPCSLRPVRVPQAIPRRVLRHAVGLCARRCRSVRRRAQAGTFADAAREAGSRVSKPRIVLAPRLPRVAIGLV